MNHDTGQLNHRRSKVLSCGPTRDAQYGAGGGLPRPKNFIYSTIYTHYYGCFTTPQRGLYLKTQGYDSTDAAVATDAAGAADGTAAWSAAWSADAAAAADVAAAAETGGRQWFCGNYYTNKQTTKQTIWRT